MLTHTRIRAHASAFASKRKRVSPRGCALLAKKSIANAFRLHMRATSQKAWSKGRPLRMRICQPILFIQRICVEFAVRSRICKCEHTQTQNKRYTNKVLFEPNCTQLYDLQLNASVFLTIFVLIQDSLN